MLIPFDQLFARYRIQAPGVLHLGANTGQEAEAYAKHGIKQVVWVEALPELLAPLRKHVSKYPGSVVLPACVSDKDGESVVFHVANNQSQSSSFLDFGTHEKEHPTVRFVQDIVMTTSRVDTLLLENGIQVGQDWFLNADLQGAELLALKGLGALLFRFKYAYIEVNVNYLYKGCALEYEIDEYLKRFGLLSKEVKMTGNGWGDKFYMKG